MMASPVSTSISAASDILVTGGTGFLGRVLVNRLMSAGHTVRILSRTGIRSENPRLRPIRGDLTSTGDLREAMRGVAAVFHCAAERTKIDLMSAVNVTGTKLVFELAAEMRVGYFCHLSSVGVIGKVTRSVVDEDSPCNPMNRYEETKLAAENIVRLGIDSGHVVILRPTNIFGSETLRPLLENSWSARLRLFLRGSEFAHLVYVEDVVAAAVHRMLSPVKTGVETFIVSSDEDGLNTHADVQSSLARLVRGSPRSLGISAPLFIPYWMRRIKHGSTNWGDVIYLSRRLRTAGFEFPFGLQAGLNRAVTLIDDLRAAR
jgi:nucleoside-diphosphate-sugar epimerase